MFLRSLIKLFLQGWLTIAGAAKCDSPPTSFLSEYPQTCIEHEGLQRCWFTFVPKSLVANSFAPLVVDMHGFKGCASWLAWMSGWKEKAETFGFFVAWPQGTEDLPDARDPEPAWNAGKSCCGSAAAMEIDDVGFLRKVVSNSAAAFNIDLARVYMAGHSNGCAMAQRMAAQSSDIVAAVACHAMYLVAPKSHDFAPVPMMEIHGTADRIVRYEGSRLGEGRGAVSNLESWRDFNNCQGDAVDTDSGAYTVRTYRNCADATEVALITLPGVGHSPYRGKDTSVDTTQLAWDFVRRFHKPSAPAPTPTPAAAPTPSQALPSPTLAPTDPPATQNNTGDDNGTRNSTGDGLISSAQGCEYQHLSVALSALLLRYA